MGVSFGGPGTGYIGGVEYNTNYYYIRPMVAVPLKSIGTSIFLEEI